MANDKKIDLNDPKYQGYQFDGNTYWTEPSLLDKVKIKTEDYASNAAQKILDSLYDLSTFDGKPKKDKVESKKKGGKVRGHGIETKGKTRGRFV